MPEFKALNIAEELCGLPVLTSETARLQGQVSEIIVHPIAGSLLALLVKLPDGREQAVAGTACDFFGAAGAVLISQHALTESQRLAPLCAEGVAVNGTLLGASVVTEEGKLLGRVSEVYLHEEHLQVSYRITKSKFQRLWGGGFFLAGYVPLTWSSIGARLIVPADTSVRHAAPTLQALLTKQLARPSKKGAYQWAGP
jgi:uncharacterized protein YrrD